MPTSKKLAKALELEEGELVSIAYSSRLETYLVFIVKEREIAPIDPSFLEIVSTKDLGELVEELLRIG